VAIVEYHKRLEINSGADREEMVKHRQELFKKEDWKVYEAVVRDMYVLEETVFNQLFDEVLDHLKIDQ